MGARSIPDLVDAILPFCASARTSPHNQVFLEGVKAALTRRPPSLPGGDYASPPEDGSPGLRTGLRRDGRTRRRSTASASTESSASRPSKSCSSTGSATTSTWDANDLLAKLRTWQLGDISANEVYRGDFERALGAIRARAILVPCTTDLYFPPEDNAIEAAHMPNAELRPFASPWGHCVATPSREGSDFLRVLDAYVSELLAGRGGEPP